MKNKFINFSLALLFCCFGFQNVYADITNPAAAGTYTCNGDGTVTINVEVTYMSASTEWLDCVTVTFPAGWQYVSSSATSGGADLSTVGSNVAAFGNAAFCPAGDSDFGPMGGSPDNFTFIMTPPAGFTEGDCTTAADGDPISFTWTYAGDGYGNAGASSPGVNGGEATTQTDLVDDGSTVPPPPCESGTLVTPNPIDVCPGETFDFEVTGEIIPTGGDYSLQFVAAGGTGGTASGTFTIGGVPNPWTLDAGVNGILAANGLADLVGTWELTGIAEDANGSPCTPTTAPLTVNFLDPADPNTANVCTIVTDCIAGTLNTPGPVDACPGDVIDFGPTGTTVPTGGGFEVNFDGTTTGGTGGLAGGVTLLTGVTPPYSFDEDLNGILSSNSLAAFAGTWLVTGYVTDGAGNRCDSTAVLTVNFLDAADPACSGTPVCDANPDTPTAAANCGGTSHVVTFGGACALASAPTAGSTAGFTLFYETDGANLIDASGYTTGADILANINSGAAGEVIFFGETGDCTGITSGVQFGNITCDPITLDIYVVPTEDDGAGGTGIDGTCPISIVTITINPQPQAPTIVRDNATCTYSYVFNCDGSAGAVTDASATVLPGLTPGDAATTVDVDVTNSAGCSATYTGLAVEACPFVGMCSITPDAATSIACDDGGTAGDPADDTFTFTITVNGANTMPGASGTFSDDQGNANVAYGTAVNYGPFPISGGDVTINFTDTDDTGCTGMMMATAPMTCSNACIVDGGTLSTTSATTVCALDGNADIIDAVAGGDQAGDNFGWLITDGATGDILSMGVMASGSATFSPDLEGAPVGTCNIYVIAWNGNLTGADQGSNISGITSDECFDLSDTPIAVTREDCPDGVTLNLSDPCNCFFGIDTDGDGINNLARAEIVVTPGVAPYSVTSLTGAQLYDDTGAPLTQAGIAALINAADPGTGVPFNFYVYITADGTSTYTMTVVDAAGASDDVSGGPCTVCTGEPIPTASEWGLIILALILLSFGAVFIRQTEGKMAGNTGLNLPIGDGIRMPFERQLYFKALLWTGFIACIAAICSLLIYGEITMTDIVGSILAAPVFTYLMHIFFIDEASEK